MKLKILAVALSILVILSLTLLMFKMISTMTFWMVIIVCAIMAYKVIPYLKKRGI